MSTSKVHRVKDRKKLVKLYSSIPYAELADLLKKDDEAFLEGPVKRQTVWKAAKKLSNMVGKKVIAERALLRLPGEEFLEGYSFSVAPQGSPRPKDTS